MLRQVFRVAILTAALLLITMQAAAQGYIEKEYRVEQGRETHNAEFYTDFFTLFSEDGLSLGEAEQRAAYDVLLSAAKLIEKGHYENAADHLAVLPKEVEATLRPVIATREDMLAIDPIRPFADHEARGELMKYHRDVWTAHPEFAEDFQAFGEDLAKRASRREKIEGAPYIIEHLNDYGFVPKDEGGPLQAYQFIWVKFNAISKFADVCDKFGVDYADISVEEFEARVAWGLAERIFASKEEARDREQGILSWTELIETYVPEEEPVEEVTIEVPAIEEYAEPEEEPVVEEEVPEEVPGEVPPPVEEEPTDEPPFEVLINPLSLFTPPPGVVAVEETEIPVPPVEEEPLPEPEEEETVETEPAITSTEVAEAAESGPLFVPPVTEPEVSVPVTRPVIDGELPARIDAVPVPPGDVSGELRVGTNAEIGPAGTSTVVGSMDEDEVRLRLAAIAEEAIDNAAEMGLKLGYDALDLAMMLIDDPKHESDETREKLDKFRGSRTEFLAASALIDRYELEQYLEIPIEMINEEIIAELRRPYDDFKTSPLWEEYRQNESDFDDAFLRIASDFRERRTRESIYAGEMAALEKHIIEYEAYMLELEELVGMLSEVSEEGDGG